MDPRKNRPHFRESKSERFLLSEQEKQPSFNLGPGGYEASVIVFVPPLVCFACERDKLRHKSLSVSPHFLLDDEWAPKAMATSTGLHPSDSFLPGFLHDNRPSDTLGRGGDNQTFCLPCVGCYLSSASFLLPPPSSPFPLPSIASSS